MLCYTTTHVVIRFQVCIFDILNTADDPIAWNAMKL